MRVPMRESKGHTHPTHRKAKLGDIDEHDAATSQAIGDAES